MENFCRLKDIYRLIQDLENKIQKAHNLSANECMALCSIKKGHTSASEIANCLSQAKSRMSLILAGLEKKHLIVRELDKKDRRKTIFKLTEIGEKKAIEVDNSDVEIPDLNLSCDPC